MQHSCRIFFHFRINKNVIFRAIFMKIEHGWEFRDCRGWGKESDRTRPRGDLIEPALVSGRNKWNRRERVSDGLSQRLDLLNDRSTIDGGEAEHPKPWRMESAKGRGRRV